MLNIMNAVLLNVWILLSSFKEYKAFKLFVHQFDKYELCFQDLFIQGVV